MARPTVANRRHSAPDGDVSHSRDPPPGEDSGHGDGGAFLPKKLGGPIGPTTHPSIQRPGHPDSAPDTAVVAGEQRQGNLGGAFLSLGRLHVDRDRA